MKYSCQHLCKFQLFAVFGLLLFLTACNREGPPSPTAISIAEATPTEIAPTATHTSVPQSTSADNVSTATTVSQPTDTPHPTDASQATSTPLAVETPLPTATVTVEEIVCDGLLTPSQAEGPFYTPDTPERSNLVEAGQGGVPIVVTGKVFNQNCEPLAGIKLDFWQTDENGEYDNVGYGLRGHQFSDENGNYTLETILPERYPGRTPHIHLKLFTPNGQEILTSQIYFRGISDQVADSIFQPELLATDLEPEESGRKRVEFNFVISSSF